MGFVLSNLPIEKAPSVFKIRLQRSLQLLTLEVRSGCGLEQGTFERDAELLSYHSYRLVVQLLDIKQCEYLQYRWPVFFL